MTKAIWIVAAVSLAYVSTSPAAASVLANLNGIWMGRGTVKERPDAKDRRGACTLRFDTFDHGSTVTMSGRCAGPAKSVELTGKFERCDASRCIAASFFSPADGQSIRYVGSEQNTSMQLRSTSSVTIEARRYTFQLQLHLQSANSFTMTQQMIEAASGRRVRVFNMVFHKG